MTKTFKLIYYIVGKQVSDPITLTYVTTETKEQIESKKSELLRKYYSCSVLEPLEIKDFEIVETTLANDR